MSTDVENLLAAADLLSENKHYTEAKAIYYAAALIELPSLQLWGGLRTAEQYENLAFNQRLSALYPTSTRILVMEADALTRVGQIRNAIALYDKILTLVDDDSLEYYFMRKGRITIMYEKFGTTADHKSTLVAEREDNLIKEFKFLWTLGHTILLKTKAKVYISLIEYVLEKFSRKRVNFFKAVISDYDFPEEVRSLLDMKIKELEMLDSLKNE